MVNRRKFIGQMALIPGGIYAFSTAPIVADIKVTPAKAPPFTRFVAVLDQLPQIALPGGKRIPLAKTGFPIPADGRVRLRFPTLRYEPGSYLLRLTAAIDFREEKTIQVTLADTGETIGDVDSKYAHPFQPFQIPVDKKWISLIQQQGLFLTQTKGTTDAWFLTPEPGMDEFEGLRPQLLLSTRMGTERGFLTNLYSMNAFSPFGWLGGCVMDGLHELSRKGDARARAALDNYLNVFLDDQKGIVYENPMTVPIDGSFNSIEDFLPFACIVDRFPAHNSIQKATAFLLARRNADGLIVSGNDATTEGCYTVAYPLAAIAKNTRDKQLAQIALDQLTHRMRLLTDDQAIYQRSTLQGGKSYRNWGRGVAWYLLGSVKTLWLLQEAGFTDLMGLEDVRQSVRTNLLRVIDLQTEKGLFYSYIDQPKTGVDTSATAGIATALGWSCRLGIFPITRLINARHSYESLQAYLTPDGFLTSVSQINRGGEGLQQNGYRVISQFGMGLMGQLKAVLTK